MFTSGLSNIAIKCESDPKVGILNLSPHLRNSAILQTTKSIAGLQTKKSCGTAIADPLKI